MAKKKKTGRYMAYFIAILMLLSAFYMGLRANEGPVRSTGAGGFVGYNVSIVGDSSAQVRVNGEAKDIIAIPDSMRYMTVEDVSYVLDNNLSGVSNTTFEYTNSYAFFRFQKGEGEINESAVTRLLDGYIREYRIYKIYDGDYGGSALELIGEPNLTEGDSVMALLFRRGDNGNLIGIQASRLVPGSSAGNESAE